jgi:SAM-dependent methyltransferase
MGALNLGEFYDSEMGRRTRRILLGRVMAAWPNLKGLRLLGYGYAAPYLDALLPQAERAICASPADMPSPLPVTGASGRCLSVLTEEDALPFPDAFFDRILVVHGLESAQSLRPLLRQLWRVLAPEGRLLVVAPNRASLWAQVDRSPFGHGRPFSRSELDTILKGALFEPEQWGRALYAPPFTSRALFRSGLGWERFGTRFFPRLGGVHIAEARKSLYAPTSLLAAEKRVLGARLTAARTE